MGSYDMVPLAVLAAAVIGVRVGWYLTVIILNDPCSKPNLPLWLIEYAPLKGRWLRLLLAAPGISVLTLAALLLAATGILLTGLLAPLVALVSIAVVVEHLPPPPLKRTLRYPPRNETR